MNVTTTWQPTRIKPQPGERVLALSLDLPFAAVGTFDSDTVLFLPGGKTAVTKVFRLRLCADSEVWDWFAFDLWCKFPDVR